MNTYTIRGIALLLSIVAVITCVKEPAAQQELSSNSMNKTYVIEAIQADSNSLIIEDSRTKTVLENGTSVFWSSNDSINVFYGNFFSGKFVSVDTSSSAKTSFVGKFNKIDGTLNEEGDISYIWGVYPFSKTNTYDNTTGNVTLTLPAMQTALAGTFASNLFPSVARSKDFSLAFYNICGGIMFTVSQEGIMSVTLEGNNNENLAGTVSVAMDENGRPVVQNVLVGKNKIKVLAPDEKGFITGAKYYIVSLPVTFQNGFSITYSKKSSEGTFSTSQYIKISRSVFGKVIDMDQYVLFDPTQRCANCFIISEYGPVVFDCTKKGNSEESVGEIASAEVLWESFGTSTTPNVGDIVSGATYSNGKVNFTANADGNAVIAVKDASDKILWSWHIWVCDGFDPEKTAQIYNNNAGIMMDRNLGATSATPGDVHALGLLYQWGRKDPFLSGDKISYSSWDDQQQAASTLSWPSPVSSDANNGTIAYAVAHPTTFITENYDNHDWYYTGSKSKDNTRWQTSKTMYDPCPQGWRVPDGGDSGVWRKAFDSSSYVLSSGPWDDANKGMNFGSGNGKSSSMQLGAAYTIWYPATGYRGESLNHVGEYASYWSCTPGGNCAYFLDFSYSGYVRPSYSWGGASGFSVRCLSE